MAESVDVVRRVSFVASRAGVGRVSALRAGRRGNGSLVVVAESVNVGVDVAVAAGAGVSRVSAFRAGRRSYDCREVMYVTERRNDLFSGLAAAAAGVEHRARFCLGGLKRHDAVVPVMTESVDWTGLRRAASRARSGLFARCGAGRSRGDGPVAPVVAESVDIADLDGSASRAHPALRTDEFAGRRFGLCPVAPVVAESFDVIVNVAVAAGAGVGGITLDRAGRRGDDRDVVVSVNDSDRAGYEVEVDVMFVVVDEGGSGIERYLISGSFNGSVEDLELKRYDRTVAGERRKVGPDELYRVFGHSAEGGTGSNADQSEGGIVVIEREIHRVDTGVETEDHGDADGLADRCFDGPDRSRRVEVRRSRGDSAFDGFELDLVARSIGDRAVGVRKSDGYLFSVAGPVGNSEDEVHEFAVFIVVVAARGGDGDLIAGYGHVERFAVLADDFNEFKLIRRIVERDGET